MATDTIKAIQKQIIVKLEAGEDVSELTRRLAQEKAKIAAQVDIDQLSKIADARQALRDKAEVVKAKVQKQGKAIDAFLEARDILVKQLHPLLEPTRELAQMGAAAWEREPGVCYSGFGDIGQFAAAIRNIPQAYLPAAFGCPFLEMAGGEAEAYGKPREAYSYLVATYGILTNLQKGISSLPAGPDGEFDGELKAESGPACIVCQHPELEAIDKALQNGRSLRDIEAEFGISKSSLSRHKQHIAVSVSQEG